MKLSVIVIAESQSAVMRVDGDVDYIEARHWGDGVQQARGERIAILNDRYQPRPGWIDAAKNTVAEMSWGTVEPGDAGWPYYLLEYAHLLGNQDPRRAPAGNVVYHRSVINRYPMAGFAREVDYHAHLISQGVSTAFRPALSVTLVRPPDWRAYRKQRFKDSKSWALAHHPDPHSWRGICRWPLLPRRNKSFDPQNCSRPSRSAGRSHNRSHACFTTTAVPSSKCGTDLGSFRN